MISYVDEFPITVRDLASATRKDPLLGRVYDFTLHGWPQSVEDPSLLPFFSCCDELSADQGCVLWGLRVLSLKCIGIIFWMNCTRNTMGSVV